MVFNPFFLNRQQNKSACAAVNGKTQEFHPELAKISYIHENSLKLIPCKKALTHTDTCEGVPFDISGLIASLTIGKQRSILPFLAKELLIRHTKEEVVILLCAGSIVDGKIPFVRLSLCKEEPCEFGEVDPTYQFSAENVYQLLYIAA